MHCPGTFLGFNKIAEFWGNASFRASQILRPNEAIHWYAMRYWKVVGCKSITGVVKEITKKNMAAHLTKLCGSPSLVIGLFRDCAITQEMFDRKQRLLGWLQGRPVQG